MICSPDIQVSKDARTWFSVFDVQGMMIFGKLMANIEVNSTTDKTPAFWIRIQPNPPQLQFTPQAGLCIGLPGIAPGIPPVKIG